MRSRSCFSFIWFGVLLLFAVCAAAQSKSSARRNDKSSTDSNDAREYSVLAAILKLHYNGDGRSVVINDTLEPCGGTTSSFVGTDAQISASDVESAFRECHSNPNQKVGLSRLHIKNRLIPIVESEYRKYFKLDCEEGWNRFYRKYPKSHGYVQLSRVGFVPSKKFALLNFSYMAGCMNGEGHLLLLKNVDGEWKVVGDASLWMV
jgi:hypothetical protein